MATTPRIRRFLMRDGAPVGWIAEGHRCWRHQNEPAESRAFACPECGQSWRRWPDGTWAQQPWLEPPYTRREFLVGARSGMFNDEALFLGDAPPFAPVRCTADTFIERYVDDHGVPRTRETPSGRFMVGIMGAQGQTLCGEGMTFCTVAENLGLEVDEFGRPFAAREWMPTPRPICTMEVR